MGFLIVCLKIILMLVAVCLLMLPLYLEYRSYKRDCVNSISHKRFRLLVFSVLYGIAVTVVLTLFNEFITWVNSLSVIIWISNQISIPSRFTYCVEVISIMLVNLTIGVLFRALLSLVRIGLKKKDLTKRKKNGKFSLLKRIERSILKYFNNEKWFFAGMILKFLCPALVIVYSASFFLYLMPIFFGASWIPYTLISRVFEAGYIYPIVTLIVLCEAYFFISGVENLERECPDFNKCDENETGVATKPTIDEINNECKKLFKDYFEHEIEATATEMELSGTEYHRVTKLIADSVESNSRNPKPICEGYLRCLNAIVENDIGPDDLTAGTKSGGVLVNGSIFTGFDEYFMRYISVILSRGDNVIFVCNDNAQIEQTLKCVEKSLEQIYSLYSAEVSDVVDFDNPVWKVQKVDSESGEIEISAVNNCSVLITDLHFLTTAYFEQQCDTFIQLIDTVVIVDALGIVNDFSRQLSIFDAKVRNLRDQNANRAVNSSKRTNTGVNHRKNDNFNVRYTSNQIKYICFDDSRIPGLDKVLKNLLFVDFVSTDAMHYGAQSIISFYNYEGRENEKGERERIQIAHTEEDLGVLVNMADFAVGCGSGKVVLLAERNMPFKDLIESIDANANQGLRVRNDVNLSINDCKYDLDNCRVIVAYDHNDNLPMAVRRYRAMASDEKTLIMVFSRPYMFRDYYIAHIDQIWESEQLMRIPVEQTGRYYAIQKILVKANSGGISVDELINILTDAQLPDYADLLKACDIPGILRKILIDCGKHPNEIHTWDDFFEFVENNTFDNRGDFVMEEKICLRNKRTLGKLIGAVSPSSVVIDGKEYPIPVPQNRITQNYIVGQNLLYDGCVYVVISIDTAKGKIFVKHATGGRNNVPYQYIQNREYHVDYSNPNPERIYPIKQVEFNGEGDIVVKEAKITVSRRPMEVITHGYSVVDQRTMSFINTQKYGYYTIDGDEQIDKFKQTYRKYGNVETPICSSELMMKSNVSYINSHNEAMVMSIKLRGEFGEDNSRTVLLASVMLNELLKTMFPSVSDSVVVCPVLNMDTIKDEESLEVMRKVPKVYCRGYDANHKDIELLIIEDCPTDLGVISVLMSSGDDVLKMLFEPIYEYLNWYQNEEKPSDYLNFGMKSAPKCFDFENLYKLASALGKDEFKLKFVDVESAMQYDVCDFCGSRYIKGSDIEVLADGRKMCKKCAGSLVANDKKILKAHLERAKIFLESTYGITLDGDYEFCFESTVKIANTLKHNRDLIKRGSDVPLKSYIDDKKKVHVEYSIPSVSLSELLVRELTHVWQLKHLPDVAEDLAEGHIALVAIQYLRFLNQNSLASVRANYYESTSNTSGEGYRKLVKALLENPQFNNNPFRYLLEATDGSVEDEIIPPAPRVVEVGDYGLPYIPENPDRALDGNLNYFYYSRLTASRRKAYDILLTAISNHEEKVVVEGCSFADIDKVTDAIEYDHPELFWYKTFSMCGTEVTLLYGATAEEAAVLQRRIDEVVPKYLEGIDDSMSAYDVALRVHIKVIASVDYDTIALNRQQQEGGPAKDKIDYLRTICGVFLEGKSVCEGYARAMQYLLQKCGVECAEVAGYIRKETGERDGAHAWNILKIDGDYYYLDTTWDDSSNTVQTVKTNDLGFDYFCITTDEMTRTRDIDLCPTDVPSCVATRGNYYYHNDMVLDTYDLNKIKAIAQTAAKNKSKSFTFKCKTKALFDQAMSNMCSVGQDCYDALKAAAKIDKQILSNTYSYSYDKNIWTITVKFKYK